MLTGNVLITGGSGFLGRGIIRRAKAEGWPAKFTIYSRDETKQWELQHRWPDVRCVLGDVARDLPRLIAVMTGHDLVIHAAAVKYIPEAEWNVYETIDVNVIGSRHVAMAAAAASVPKVIGISTDKASAPLNTYGMTKGLMERIFSEAARRPRGTHFATVRYGNVVGSTGSVIPVFEKQIREYGEIRITDERMSRFWLSVDDAVDLILLASEVSEKHPGATVIGENKAMTIKSLADAVWQIHWRNYDESGAISVTGIRPGEKLAESLFNAQEAPRVTRMNATVGGVRSGFILQPPTHKACNDPLVPANGYSSDAPVGWLTAEEMVKMIREAQTV